MPAAARFPVQPWRFMALCRRATRPGCMTLGYRLESLWSPRSPQVYLLAFLAFLAFRFSFALSAAVFCCSLFPLSLLPLSPIVAFPCPKRATLCRSRRLADGCPDVTLPDFWTAQEKRALQRGIGDPFCTNYRFHIFRSDGTVLVWSFSRGRVGISQRTRFLCRNSSLHANIPNPR